MTPVSSFILPVLTLVASINAWDSTIHSIVAPTAPPNVTSEAWRCLTENATQYFKVPLPTGSLSSAIDSYADEAMAPCLSTIDPVNRLYGCFPHKEKWCDFTATASPALLSGWSSLGSAASVWWESQSSAAVSLAQKCPLRYYDASLGVLGGSTLLNETIIFAACYAEAHTTGASSNTASTASTKQPNATPGSGANSAPTPTGNSVQGRTAVPELWVVASSGFAAAAVSAAF